MPAHLSTEIAALERLSVSQLRARFADVLGAPTPSHNKVWLVKRIAWRLQALAEGDLSERARQRAAELLADADLRLSAPSDPVTAADPAASSVATLRLRVDPRVRPGTILTRRYKGRTLQVQVLEQGFLFEEQVYRSLSAVAKAVTGSHCSGYFFFGLTAKGAKP